MKIFVAVPRAAVSTIYSFVHISEISTLLYNYGAAVIEK